jgi:hypothetical protein
MSDWTTHSLAISELTDEMRKILPPTDSRVRSDRYALEKEDTKKAAADKHALEEKQRAEERKRIATNQTWVPKYFVVRLASDPYLTLISNPKRMNMTGISMESIGLKERLGWQPESNTTIHTRRWFDRHRFYEACDLQKLPSVLCREEVSEVHSCSQIVRERLYWRYTADLPRYPTVNFHRTPKLLFSNCCFFLLFFRLTYRFLFVNHKI